MAIIVALMSMLLLSALGAALVMTTTSETLIAGNFRNAQEALYAADAALGRAVADLATIPDWNHVLEGVAQSAFVDGPPAGVRKLSDGSRLDLGRTLNMMNCQKATACSAANLIAITAPRPWGANNPVWRLFAYGPIDSLLPAPITDSACYVIVMVGDDPTENDGDPLRDGDGETNAGSGVLSLRAEAFGSRGTHQIIELTVARPALGQPGVRILSWRLVR